MRRIYYYILFPTILSIVVGIGLYSTGYLLNKQKILPPSSPIEWNKFKEISSANISYNFPVILNLTEKMKEIPGIEYINYEVFVSNDTLQQTKEYYADLLEKEGYSYQEKYSGIKSYEHSNFYYNTFTKGLNGVVIFLSLYNQQTWICYSTGDIFHYKQIFDYLVSHNFIS